MPPRGLLDRELRELQDQMVIMASMVDKALDRSLIAFKQHDLEGSRQVIEEDMLIDKKRYEVEEQALMVIATQQPAAGDLRLVAAVLHIIVDLERIADHAEGIAKISLMVGRDSHLKPLVDIPRMAQLGREMLRGAIDAFVARDQESAKRIIEQDDEVDSLYDQVYRELLTYMLEDPHTIQRATYLLWVAHNLERVADRVTNICERVIFTVTGKMPEVKGSTY